MACTQNTISSVSSMNETQETHGYVQSKPSDSRSPCPALNTLANHGYLPRNGMDIGFLELVHALTFVYNISWFLASSLAVVAFLVSGKITYRTRSQKTSSKSRSTLVQKIPFPQWRLDLASLSVRGSTHIAHDASLVHRNSVESHSPDNNLVQKLLAFAASRRHSQGGLRGLSLADIAFYHGKRVKELRRPLDRFHEQIALGECGLAWAVMRTRLPVAQLAGVDAEHEEVISEDVLKKWFGFERLPEDWWVEGGSRPVQPIGLLEARHRARDVAKFIAKQ